MPHHTTRVSRKPTDDARIPDMFTEAAVLLEAVRQRGVIATIGKVLHIRRQGGYSALDVWLLLLILFTTGATVGVKPLWEKLRPCARQLAALAGRSGLASPASVSRALEAVETALVRPVAFQLLVVLTDIGKVMRHPAAQTYDAQGRAWHVFDLDWTVTALRQRALPAHEDLPEPRRRAEHTGAPGYLGRKRGDLRFGRMTVEHAGSSGWVHEHLSPGNGEGVVELELALDSVVATCEHLEHPTSQALVRMDGEFGHVPGYTACREHELPFLTRLTRPKLYKDPKVLDLLRRATWYLVPDSGSGPQRGATDLGEMTIKPGGKTKRPDDTDYEPVTVRVVASRFPKTGRAKRGCVVDGWQVELFAADLPADAWPAPEVVASFFGRTGEENRFAQEDRELGLDRIISYDLGGQELAALAGLSLWNLRVAMGCSQAPPPVERPVQPFRQAQIDDRAAQHWPRDPVVLALLAEQDWTTVLSGRTGWRWDVIAGELRCPDGRTLDLTTVRAGEHAKGRTGVIFRRPVGGCEDCEPRQGCLRSEQAGASKHAEFSFPTAVASCLRERLAQVRGRRSGTVVPVNGVPGPREVYDSLFLPAEARRLHSACLLGASVRIVVELPPPDPPQPRLVARDVADKQRRRKTWEQNLARYALPEEARVDVSFQGSPELWQMLGEHGQARPETARAA